MSQPNPCIHKRECKECKIANLADRPSFCIDLACPYYTPCTRCKVNMTLDSQGLCSRCVKQGRLAQVATAGGEVVEVQHTLAGRLEQEDLDVEEVERRTLTLTQPGEPPQEYTQGEKEFYQSMWKKYIEYYRDPTAMSLCHNIVILEIELNYQTSHMVSNRSRVTKEQVQSRSRLLRNLKELRDQLPKKEALEQSDDEKFISMIYERYTEEKRKTAVGKITRVLSPEALALAPSLQFPINPVDILKSLGYRMIDAVEAVNHITVDELPTDPKLLLEFFGFFLDEKYAMPLDIKVESEEPALAAIAQPSTQLPEQVSNQLGIIDEPFEPNNERGGA